MYELLGVVDSNHTAVGLWERNINMIPTDKLIEFCHLFNISADWLLFGEGEREMRHAKDSVLRVGPQSGQGS